MRPADKAWIGLALGVLVWDVAAKPGEMLSEASERYAAARPLLWRAVVLYTAGHLIHAWPDKLDLFNLSARLFGR
ncbi:Bacteriophage protein [Mycobacterium tuberculosis]|nr:Bacteriophage protein [Mycobacterium tuberculosis]